MSPQKIKEDINKWKYIQCSKIRKFNLVNNIQRDLQSQCDLYQNPRESPVNPVVRTQCSHGCGLGSIPGQGTKIPQAVQFSLVAQSCPTLCDPMDCSTPGFPVHHQLPELAQTHVHQVGDVI